MSPWRYARHEMKAGEGEPVFQTYCIRWKHWIEFPNLPFCDPKWLSRVAHNDTDGKKW